MKRILLVTLFFLFVQFGNAQHWLKEGATYNYYYSFHPSSGYRQLVYEKDTVFDGKACSQLNLFEQSCHVSNGGCYPSNYNQDFFIHKRNDSIFDFFSKTTNL